MRLRSLARSLAPVEIVDVLPCARTYNTYNLRASKEKELKMNNVSYI